MFSLPIPAASQRRLLVDDRDALAVQDPTAVEVKQMFCVRP